MVINFVEESWKEFLRKKLEDGLEDFEILYASFAKYKVHVPEKVVIIEQNLLKGKL